MTIKMSLSSEYYSTYPVDQHSPEPYSAFSFSHRWNTEKQLWQYSLLDKVYFLVNLKSCHARVLNWAIRENIHPVELAQYGIFPYWASSTGRIFSRIAQLRTLALQLLRFTRKYTLSRRIYSSIVNQ